MEHRKHKARRTETDEQRAERLEALVQRADKERRAEEDTLDAMVRRSIAAHGA
jgi:hypothetical protein